MNFFIPKYLNTQDKLELLLADKKFTSRFWTNLVPVESIHNECKPSIRLIKNLAAELFEEIRQKSANPLRVKPSELFNSFVRIAYELLKYNPTSISVEITSVNSVFIFCIIDNKNFYLELFFDDSSGKLSEAVINIYIDKIQEFALNGDLAETIQELDEYLNQGRESFLEYISDTADLSRSAFATAGV